jgi:hypothetical protein
MGLKDRYNSSVSSAETPAAGATPERDLAALRAKLASGQTGGVNPPEAKDRMTDDMVAPQTPAASLVSLAGGTGYVAPSTPQPSTVTSAALSAASGSYSPVAVSAATTTPAAATTEPPTRGRGRAAKPAVESLSTEQIVEMLVSRGYAVNLERR